MANLRCVAGVYDSKQLSDDQISCILGPHDVYDGSSIISWPKTVVVALVRSWTLVGQNKTTGSMVSLPFKKIVATRASVSKFYKNFVIRGGSLL